MKTTLLPVALTLVSPVSANSGCCGCVGSFRRLKLYATSRAVSGCPSLHFTPLRIVIAYVVFDVHVPPVASQGMNLSLSGS